jgi:hypothetical protein
MLPLWPKVHFVQKAGGTAVAIANGGTQLINLTGIE